MNNSKFYLDELIKKHNIDVKMLEKENINIMNTLTNNVNKNSNKKDVPKDKKLEYIVKLHGGSKLLEEINEINITQGWNIVNEENICSLDNLNKVFELSEIFITKESALNKSIELNKSSQSTQLPQPPQSSQLPQSSQSNESKKKIILKKFEEIEEIKEIIEYINTINLSLLNQKLINSLTSDEYKIINNNLKNIKELLFDIILKNINEKINVINTILEGKNFKQFTGYIEDSIENNQYISQNNCKFIDELSFINKEVYENFNYNLLHYFLERLNNIKNKIIIKYIQSDLNLFDKILNKYDKLNKLSLDGKHSINYIDKSATSSETKGGGKKREDFNKLYKKYTILNYKLNSINTDNFDMYKYLYVNDIVHLQKNNINNMLYILNNNNYTTEFISNFLKNNYKILINII